MKLAVITGGSRGIGAQLVRSFSEKGYYVALNYFKSKECAEELRREVKNCEIFRADVSDENQVNRMFRDIREAFGKPADVLVNNAGISQSGLFTDTDVHDYNSIFDTNVKSVYLCSKAVASDMITKKYGRIINISSVWGQTGASCEVLYSASKAAVIGMTKALAKELGPSGITVNCIAPGVIKTDMLSCYTQDTLDELSDETPMSRLGTPLDIANAALFLAEDASDFITGQVLAVNGGFYI